MSRYQLPHRHIVFSFVKHFTACFWFTWFFAFELLYFAQPAQLTHTYNQLLIVQLLLIRTFAFTVELKWPRLILATDLVQGNGTSRAHEQSTWMWMWMWMSQLIHFHSSRQTYSCANNLCCHCTGSLIQQIQLSVYL